MSTYRQIQIGLGTILLWSSTSVSSFAATSTITPGKLQSDTVTLPVESIPVRPLNLKPDPYLVAGQLRDMVSRSPLISNLFVKFDEIWKNPADRQKNLFDYCNASKDLSVNQCFSFLQIWVSDTMDNQEYQNIDELQNINNEIFKMRENLR